MQHKNCRLQATTLRHTLEAKAVERCLEDRLVGENVRFERDAALLDEGDVALQDIYHDESEVGIGDDGADGASRGRCGIKLWSCR